MWGAYIYVWVGMGIGIGIYPWGVCDACINYGLCVCEVLSRRIEVK